MIVADERVMKNRGAVRKVTQLFLQYLAEQGSILSFDLLQAESIRVVQEGRGYASNIRHLGHQPGGVVASVEIKFVDAHFMIGSLSVDYCLASLD